jgi:hypothetical protein
MVERSFRLTVRDFVIVDGEEWCAVRRIASWRGEDPAFPFDPFHPWPFCRWNAN